uniref:mRNA guanylyltransferase n=1 Tax=Globodera pallida TaxID=36090 RepID=A0A183CKR1_GLOPA
MVQINRLLFCTGLKRLLRIASGRLGFIKHFCTSPDGNFLALAGAIGGAVRVFKINWDQIHALLSENNACREEATIKLITLFWSSDQLREESARKEMNTGGKAVSVLSPERRIELNTFDVDAWSLLLRESQARPIDQVRSFYEKIVTQFNNAGRYWKAYIEHELRAKNFDNVETVKCLVRVLNIDLWKCYVFYVKETKGHLASFREQLAQTYDFALEKVGLDFQSYSIYLDYVTFLKSVNAVGQYAENQKITAIRKIYRRGLSTPMANIEQLWNDYCTFEKGINSTLAEKMIAEANKDYQIARKMAKQYEQVTRGINRQAISIPPRGTSAEMKQAELWRKFIQWEKSNPTGTEEYGQLAKRVIYAYEQSLLCIGYMPDIWYEAAFFQQQAAQKLAEKGDVKLSTVMLSDVIKLYERAISGLMKDNQMLHFAYADFEEEKRRFENAKKIYDRLLACESVDPTLAYIQLMKFVRRTEGVKHSRLVFKRAREDKRSNFHVFVAAAFLEYYCSKRPDVAKRIFDLGLKKHGSDPQYALAYVEFLSHLNEDNNTRVVFERLLNSENAETWDKYLEFESQVGDLTSVLKVDQRRRNVNPEGEDRQALWLIDRYKFLHLTPCTTDQLKLMGYSSKITRQMAAVPHQNGFAGSSSASVPPNALQNGRMVGAPQQSSSTPAVGFNIELGGYARPDTSQMLPFKPKLPPASYHPVPGGVFPPPPIVSQLLQLLPPPRSFSGPFVDVEDLMKSLASFNREPPKTNAKETLDPNAGFDGYRASDVKKEFYQLLNTTTDPLVLMASQEQHSFGLPKKRTIAGGDSDSEDEDSNQQLRNFVANQRTRLPARWLYCPPMGKVVAQKFLPMKTPLDDSYDHLIESSKYFFHPSSVFRMPLLGAAKGAKIGLWIDLTNSDNFYNGDEVVRNGCKFLKMKMVGHEEAPTAEQTTAFIETIERFVGGFNRTGFLISAYLYEKCGMSIEMAAREFAECRPNGIYKQHYLDDLRQRYGDEDEDEMTSPGRPLWGNGPVSDEEFTNHGAFHVEAAETNNGIGAGVGGMTASSTSTSSDSNNVNNTRNSHLDRPGKSAPQFIDGKVSGVNYVEDQSVRRSVQEKTRHFCGHGSKVFPGSQPVSLEGPHGNNNIEFLAQEPYMVSWKADGVRYLVLIEGKGQVYAFDRDNNPFLIKNMAFIRQQKQANSSLEEDDFVHDTLVDAEMVIDHADNREIPRLLIYDLIQFQIYAKSLSITEAFKVGLLKREAEPIGVRRKGFWAIESTQKLLEPGFLSCHEGYVAGRFDKLLKWKPPEQSTIDFRLDIKKKETGRWEFMRERTDKSHPNALSTAESVWRPFTEYVNANLTLSNPSQKDVYFKVKTTAPKFYCVRPNSGVIKPVESPETLESERSRHKFMIQTAFATTDEQPSVEQFWKTVDSSLIMDSKLRVVFHRPFGFGDEINRDETDTSGAFGTSYNKTGESKYEQPIQTAKSMESKSSDLQLALQRETELRIMYQDEKLNLEKENYALIDKLEKMTHSAAAGSIHQDNVQLIHAILFAILALLVGLIVGKLL